MTYRRNIKRVVFCLSIVVFIVACGINGAQAQDEEDLLDFFPSANPVLPPTGDQATPTTPARPTPAVRSAPGTQTHSSAPITDPDSPDRTTSVLSNIGTTQPATTTRPAVVSHNSSLTQARQLSQAFRVAADKVKPTVVTIRMGNSRDKISTNSGSQFEDWASNPSGAFKLRPDESVGSGFVVDTKGIILTNYHVLKDFPIVLVELPNGRQFETTEVRYDEETDLAVVWIDTKDPLPAATLGNSDEMETGDWVLAIGSPFGLNQTVSAGIISGKSRSLHRHSGSRFLQTDAAINPGNSGGPLVNLDGQVIGINSAIVSQSGGYQGIGFAIPSNLVKWVMSELINNGSVRRGYLGVAVTSINANIASRFGVKPGSGVIITDVYANTPAARAGMLVGDIITSFDNMPIRSQRDLRELIERATGGDRRPITVIRDRKEQKIEVAFEQEGGTFNERNLPPTLNTNADEHVSRDMGFAIAKLTPEIAGRLELDKVAGVLINQIAEGGPAHREGLESGNVILRVGRTEVNSVQEFVKAMESENPEKGVLFLIRTDVGNRYIVLKKQSN